MATATLTFPETPPKHNGAQIKLNTLELDDLSVALYRVVGINDLVPLREALRDAGVYPPSDDTLAESTVRRPYQDHTFKEHK